MFSTHPHSNPPTHPHSNPSSPCILHPSLSLGVSNSASSFTNALTYWYGATLITSGEIDFKQLMTAMMALMLSAIGNTPVQHTLSTRSRTHPFKSQFDTSSTALPTRPPTLSLRSHTPSHSFSLVTLSMIIGLGQALLGLGDQKEGTMTSGRFVGI